jgi:hypothetical protein
MDIRTIHIAEWNANGLLNHKLELMQFLQDNKIDVLLVSETHFTGRTVPKIPNYSIYHCNHPDGTAHGGAAILICKALQHYEFPAYQTDKIQADIIPIKGQPWSFNNDTMWSPPRHRIEVEVYKNFLRHLGNKFMVGGDWNAKHTNWGSILTTPKGRNLLQSITNHNCSYLSMGEPTYWLSDPNKMPDLLDFFMFKSIATNYIQIKANWDLSSDHIPIITTLSTHIIHKPKTPRLTSPKTDWNAFRTHIDESIKLNIKLKQPDNIDEKVNSITRLIQEVASRSTPPEIIVKDPTSFIPLYIRKLVTEKRRARNRWQRTRNPIDKREYNQLTRQLKAAFQDTWNATFETYINSLSKEDHTIWKATKQFKRAITHIPPILQEDGNWGKTDKEKATAFAESLSKIFTTPQTDDNTTEDIVKIFLDSACPMTLPIKPFSPTEVREEINKYNNHKAPGFDLITG